MLFKNFLIIGLCNSSANCCFPENRFPDSMVLNLSFANNTILSCFFLFFLIIDLYFLIPVVITQIFNTAV